MIIIIYKIFCSCFGSVVIIIIDDDNDNNNKSLLLTSLLSWQKNQKNKYK